MIVSLFRSIVSNEMTPFIRLGWTTISNEENKTMGLIVIVINESKQRLLPFAVK